MVNREDRYKFTCPCVAWWRKGRRTCDLAVVGSIPGRPLSSYLYVNSALHRSGVGKSSTGLTGVKTGRVHLCPAAVVLKKNLDPEGGTVVVLLVIIGSLKIPKTFLIRSGVQRNFAYTFVLTFHTDLPFQIFC